MKSLIITLILASFTQADILCQSAGADVEQYSREYDYALSEYENAVDDDTLDSDEKEDAEDEMQNAKRKLLNATNDVFSYCENTTIRVMGEVLKEKEALENRVAELLEENMILKLKLKYPSFNLDKIINYLNEYEKKYGKEEADKINNHSSIEKIWEEFYMKK